MCNAILLYEHLTARSSDWRWIIWNHPSKYVYKAWNYQFSSRLLRHQEYYAQGPSICWRQYVLSYTLEERQGKIQIASISGSVWQLQRKTIRQR